MENIPTGKQLHVSFRILFIHMKIIKFYQLLLSKLQTVHYGTKIGMMQI